MSTTKTTKTAKVETKAADKEVKAEVKAEPAKTTATKTTTTKKAAEVKVEAPKAEPAKKAPAKKATTTKATPVKKAEKATEEVFIEYAGSQVSTAEIKDRVVEATGKKASAIKSLNIYVQPETGKIYYTADGETGEIAY